MHLTSRSLFSRIYPDRFTLSTSSSRDQNNIKDDRDDKEIFDKVGQR